jgi:hypothetical protein
MKNNKIKFGAIFIVVLTMAFLSCTKIDTSSPSESKPVKVTSVIRSTPQSHPDHVTKIRLCLKNNTSNTLYYCKLTLRIVDDRNDQSYEVFYTTLKFGSKDNHYWTIAPYETQWSDWIATDFHVFGEGGYETRIDETLFY